MLKNFKINTGRDLLYPNVNCYQMDLGPAVDAAIEAGLVEGEMKDLKEKQAGMLKNVSQELLNEFKTAIHQEKDGNMRTIKEMWSSPGR